MQLARGSLKLKTHHYSQQSWMQWVSMKLDRTVRQLPHQLFEQGWFAGPTGLTPAYSFVRAIWSFLILGKRWKFQQTASLLV